MIIKGKSRAAPMRLAKHLERTDTNENVEMLEFRDVPIENLEHALRHMQMLTAGTRGTKGLYHANIDPHTDFPMTREQWERAADVLEEELGLQGQPRVIVMHKKEGREHIHVVWARTDIDTLTLRSDSFTYGKHERASARLEEEFGHDHVPGKWHKRDMEQELPMADYNHAEWQQSERSGLDTVERKAEITALYEQSDNGQAFQNALEDRGYVLANGDKRVFVVVDIAGHVHSLNRQITSAKAKEIREKVADIDPAHLPDVSEARELQEQRREARRSASGREEAEQGREGAGGAEVPEQSIEPSEQPEQSLPIAVSDDPALIKARAELDQNHAQRRDRFEQEWEARIEREMDLVTRQIRERREIERKTDWKEMEGKSGFERFDHKLRDRLDRRRVRDRHDERQAREKERDARDEERRDARMEELLRDKEQHRDRMEQTFEREHRQLEEMHRRDQERARQQELDRARDPNPPDFDPSGDRPPDRGGGFDR